MTINDIESTAELVLIPSRTYLVSDALRKGDLLLAIAHAEELTQHVDRLRRRLKELVNILRDPMGS